MTSPATKATKVAPTPTSSPTPDEAADVDGVALDPGTELERRPESALFTEQGRTTIADTVVEKIAGMAAREVRGVHNLGRGTARALGAVRERIPGARASLGQGVSVEVGERQAAVDLELVVEYGAELVELTKAVRLNVINSIEMMTALEVTEVNIAVNDVFIPGDDGDDSGSAAGGSRVQ